MPVFLFLHVVVVDKFTRSFTGSRKQFSAAGVRALSHHLKSADYTRRQAEEKKKLCVCLTMDFSYPNVVNVFVCPRFSRSSFPHSMMLDKGRGQ